jgi:hypothetical protein
MLDAATAVDSVYDQEDGDRGHDGDHQESLRGDSASSVTPQDEHNRGRSRDYRDLCDVIRARDAHDRIKSRHQDLGVKSKNTMMKGTMIIMVLTLTNLIGSGHRKQDTSQEASRHIPWT